VRTRPQIQGTLKGVSNFAKSTFGMCFSSGVSPRNPRTAKLVILGAQIDDFVAASCFMFVHDYRPFTHVIAELWRANSKRIVGGFGC
jgi:hypothetical protein